jgi:hypothetical protein
MHRTQVDGEPFPFARFFELLGLMYHERPDWPSTT